MDNINTESPRYALPASLFGIGSVKAGNLSLAPEGSEGYAKASGGADCCGFRRLKGLFFQSLQITLNFYFRSAFFNNSPHFLLQIIKRMSFPAFLASDPRAGTMAGTVLPLCVSGILTVEPS